MKCSCGYVEQYLAPCCHVMAVLGESKYVLPNLFHIRWWKHYNYYFANSSDLTSVSNVHRSLVEIQNLTYDQCYDAKGSYKGCFLEGNDFLKKNHVCKTNTKESVLLQGMNSYMNSVKPIVRNDRSFLRNLPGNSSLDIHDEVEMYGFGLNDSLISEIDGGMPVIPNEEFGNGTNSLGFLSQNSLQYESLINNGSMSSRKGDDLWNLVQSTVDTIRTQEQKANFIELLRNVSANNIAENNPCYTSDKVGMTMLGCDQSGRADSTKRKRQMYER